MLHQQTKVAKVKPKTGRLTQEVTEETSEEDNESQADDRDESNDSYWYSSGNDNQYDEEENLSDDQYAGADFINEEEMLDSDESFTLEMCSKIPKEAKYQITMWSANTHYDVVKEVAKFEAGYHLTKRQRAQWDLAWWDGPIPISILSKMQPWQRCNHLPGIYNLAKKNMLGRHLMRMQKQFPSEYNFFPATYELPHDFQEFMAMVGEKRNKTFIVKPEAMSQGKGIFLTRNPDKLMIQKDESQQQVIDHMIVQRYLTKPYLIDGYKFDLRLYVLVNGIAPMRIYIFEDGLARLATVPYKTPAPNNMNNLFMHLTNYAINKENEAYQQNTDAKNDNVGHKRSYAAVLRMLRQKHGKQAIEQMVQQINDIIIKTMCIAQPHVHHLYRSCQPDDLMNQICFQILGFDVIIDQDLRPYLLEVNQMPSFATDSPLDHRIKKGVIGDTLAMLNLSVRRRYKTMVFKKQDHQKRLMSKYSRVNDNKVLQNLGQKQIDNFSLKRQQIFLEREQRRKRNNIKREKYEAKKKGSYNLLYPLISHAEEEFILQKLDKYLQQTKGQSVQISDTISSRDELKKADIAKLQEILNTDVIVEPFVSENVSSIQNFLSDQTEDEDKVERQKAQRNSDVQNLAERVLRQLKYEDFMVGAKCLWENLVGGTTKLVKKFKNEVEIQQQKEAMLNKQKVDPELRKQIIQKIQIQEQERKNKLEILQKFRSGQLTVENMQDMQQLQSQVQSQKIQEEKQFKSVVIKTASSIQSLQQLQKTQQSSLQDLNEQNQVKLAVNTANIQITEECNTERQSHLPKNDYLKHIKKIQQIKSTATKDFHQYQEDRFGFKPSIEAQYQKDSNGKPADTQQSREHLLTQFLNSASASIPDSLKKVKHSGYQEDLQKVASALQYSPMNIIEENQTTNSFKLKFTPVSINKKADFLSHLQNPSTLVQDQSQFKMSAIRKQSVQQENSTSQPHSSMAIPQQKVVTRKELKLRQHFTSPQPTHHPSELITITNSYGGQNSVLPKIETRYSSSQQQTDYGRAEQVNRKEFVKSLFEVSRSQSIQTGLPSLQSRQQQAQQVQSQKPQVNLLHELKQSSDKKPFDGILNQRKPVRVTDLQPVLSIGKRNRHSLRPPLIKKEIIENPLSSLQINYRHTSNSPEPRRVQNNNLKPQFLEANKKTRDLMQEFLIQDN